MEKEEVKAAEENSGEVSPDKTIIENVEDTSTTSDIPELNEVKDNLDELLSNDADDLDAIPSETKGEEQVPAEVKPDVKTPQEVVKAPPAEEKPKEELKPDVVKSPEQEVVAMPEAKAPATQPTSTPEDMAKVRETYEENRKAMEATLASDHYNLSEEQVTRLDDGDAQLIPELMAKVYMDAVTGSVAHMITYFPDLVQNAMDRNNASAADEKAFYDQWPDLNQEQHGEIVQRLGVAYRQLYPTASQGDFLRDVGAQAMVALKIQPTGVEKVSAIETPISPPFQPAGSGSQGSSLVKSLNPFEVLAEEAAAEDLDLD